MKTQILLILVLALGGLSAGCSKGDATATSVTDTEQRRFAMTGRVVSANLQFRKVTIAHDNIPGYMEAMTMPFTLQDEAMLRALKQGDQIRATLVMDTRTNLSWLEKFEVAIASAGGSPAAKMQTTSHH